jgi:hypothetical protein
MGVISCGTTMLDQGVFENIGAVIWDTTVKTSGFTAVSGNGYFCNTTSAAFTVTLPLSPSAGDIVGIKDYANTADTNNITIGRNSSPIQGTASDFKITTEGRSVLLVYVDATKGWLVTSASQATDITSPQFVTATGGTITTSGDYKIHTFTGPGTFCVSNAGNACGSNSVDYLVVAGGGGGSNSYAGGGGGGGGFRLSNEYSLPSPTTSPLANPTGITASVQGYPVTVGGGGGGCTSGSNSVFSTITSTGGGQGASGAPPGPNAAGGSGGGGRGVTIGETAGVGNTPPTSPPQGQNGGNGNTTGSGNETGGGGGGAGAAGTAGSGGGPGGNGGAGSFVSPSLAGCNGTPGPVGSTRYFSGGGGGSGSFAVPAPSYGTGGAGGGGAANPRTAGGTNTGGGGAGGGYSPETGATGGSGIVIIRYKFQ